MSVKIMGAVWDLDLPSDEKFVLMAYADHADHDGRNVFPSVATVARKTGYSERSVQRITRSLEAKGHLVPDGSGPRGTNRWFMPIYGGDKMTPPTPVPDEGDKMTPVTSTTGGGDKMTGGGDTAVSPEPSLEPSLNQEEEEEKKAQIFKFSADLEKRLEQAGIYRSTWGIVAERLRQGWTDVDVTRVLRWMERLCPNKQECARRFVARIREGTRAPQDEYQGDTEPREPDPLPEPGQPVTVSDAQRAWERVVDELEGTMPKAGFSTYVRDSMAIELREGQLVVAARNDYVRQWLDQRVRITAERFLVGVLNKPVTIEFVVEETPCRQ